MGPAGFPVPSDAPHLSFGVIRRRILLGLSLALAACDSSPDVPQQIPAAVERMAPASLVRLPADGGRPRVYLLPSLTESEWEAGERTPALASVAGAASETPQVLLLDRRRNLVALSLASGRVRQLLAGVHLATVSADGSFYALDSAGHPFMVGRRTPQPYQHPFGGVPTRVHVGASDRLVGVDTAAPALEVLSPSDTLRIIPLESSRVALSLWSDLAAVATDTAVVVHDPTGRTDRRRVRLEGVQGVTFSPSGHQIYAATREGVLAVIERYSLSVQRRVELPAPAGDVRAGPFGRWLLVERAGADSAWVVDLDHDSLVGTVPSAWGDEMPLITSPNVLLARDGDAIVAFDLAAAGMPEAGRLEEVGDDLVAVVQWSPARRDLAQEALDADSTAGTDSTPPDSAGTGERIYLQVSSSQNPAWAEELSTRLAGAGLAASVLAPADSSDPHRVVLGPFATREEAEQAGRTLGMPNFIITVPSPQQ